MKTQKHRKVSYLNLTLSLEYETLAWKTLLILLQNFKKEKENKCILASVAPFDIGVKSLDSKFKVGKMLKKKKK